jgi:FixJ family two-component response regulator
MFERKILVEVRRKSMADGELLALFKGGPDQAAVVGVNEICQRLEDAMILNGQRLSKMANHVKTIQAIATLTDREREILNFLCEGKSSKKIGEELGISSYTVDNHRARIMSKMGVNSVTQIVQLTLNARTLLQ